MELHYETMRTANHEILGLHLRLTIVENQWLSCLSDQDPVIPSMHV